MGWQPRQVQGLNSLARPDVLDSLDGEEQFFLMAQPDYADVLEVLPGEGGHLVDAAHALLMKRSQVLLEPEQPEPFLERAWHVFGQTVADVEVVDFRL